MQTQQLTSSGCLNVDITSALRTLGARAAPASVGRVRAVTALQLRLGAILYTFSFIHFIDIANSVSPPFQILFYRFVEAANHWRETFPPRIEEQVSQPVDRRRMRKDLLFGYNLTFTRRSDLAFVILFLTPSILFVKAFFSDVSTSYKQVRIQHKKVLRIFLVSNKLCPCLKNVSKYFCIYQYVLCLVYQIDVS